MQWFNPLISRLALPMAIAALIITSCNGGTAPADKTAQQRAEDYHRYLTTSDLSLLELRGNVKSVVYPSGFINQYAATNQTAPDTILFTPTGMCELNLMVGSDSLRAIRTPEGRIAQLAGEREGAPSIMFAYADDGTILSWQLKNVGQASSVVFEYADGKLVAIKTATGKAQVKVIAEDTLGNWTKRQLLTAGSAPVVQERIVEYY